MLRLATLLVCTICAIPTLNAELSLESGEFLFQKYSPKEYAANQQNWAVIQDARGIMYFGNTDGVLEFDGVTWRLIPLTIHSAVRALAIDSRGTVFVGARGIFGYLAPDHQGAYKFVSLLDKVPPTDRTFNDISSVLPTASGVYFVSRRRLFLYTPGGVMKVFRPSSSFGRGFTFHEEFFVTATDRGLLTMTDREKDLVAAKVRGDAKVATESPFFADGRSPLLSAGRKLYHFMLGSIDPFATAADKYFQVHAVTFIDQLPGGDIVVGTENGGLVFLSQKGEIERIIRRSDGLPSDWISAMFSDRNGDLWVATDNGIARFSPRLSRFGEEQGLHGPVYAVARLGGVIYAGTSLGLFRMNTAPGEHPVFTAVPEIQQQVFSIVEHAGLYFVAAQHGLYEVSGKGVRRLVAGVVYDVGFSLRDSDILYSAGDGIQMLKKVGTKWIVVAKEAGVGQDFRSVIEATDGSVWATGENVIWRIDFHAQPQRAQQFSAADGVPSGLQWVYLFHGRVVFATDRGLLKFSESTQRFILDTELGEPFEKGKWAVSNIREDAFKNIWLTGKGYHGFLRGGKWFMKPLLDSGLGEMYSMQLDSDRTVWGSGVSGSLFRYERPPPTKEDHLSVLIRSVTLTKKNLTVFGGDNLFPSPRLAYQDNALRIQYACPSYEIDSPIEYRFRLEGSERDWSPWTVEARKDYTNLPEGSYTFRVQARNAHWIESEEKTFRFTLLPPWYRTWWTYLFYTSLFLSVAWLILRWRLAALEAKNKWLEAVVDQRTAEVRSERDQNEALLLNILPKPIASELRSTGSVKPTSFDDVTVCFSDFVGFTLSSEKLPPQELISSLNEYFTAFDEIIGRYGLEKLKTIGDAYMFAGGLPNASPSHAVDAVLAAIEMVEVVQKLARPDKGVNWSIRLGLYSGPVVAGVVGVRKFAFDIWGNTVNFAARMESAGVANRVNLSETTCSKVFEFIDCEARGPIRIKEGREMEMYFALRPKLELELGPKIDGIPEAFRLKYEQAFSKPPRSYPNWNEGPNV